MFRRSTSRLGLLLAAILASAGLVTAPAAAEELTDQVTVHSDTSFVEGDGIRTPDVISTQP